MAPGLNSLRSSRPSRTKSVDRQEPDARWGDRSISAPTYQKQAGEPIVPAEWYSPAATLVDSSPDLSFNHDLSPVEIRRGERDTLTITIPLPWKRKSRARTDSPGETIASAGQSSRDHHEACASPEELMSPVKADAIRAQRKVDQHRSQAGTVVRREIPVLQSPRNVGLKSPMFPLSPVSSETQRSTRNVDLLTSELDAIALGQKVRSRRDLDLTPIEVPSPEAADTYQPQKGTKREHIRSSVHALTPMVGHFKLKDDLSTPVSASHPQRQPPGNTSTVTVHVRTGQHVAVDVLTPVEEGHERNGQASPYTTSIEGSPASPTVPQIQTHFLSSIIVTPVESVGEPPLSQYAYATNSTAAWNSHHTSAAPRSRSTSCHDNKRVGVGSRHSTRPAPSRNGSKTCDQEPDPGECRLSSNTRAIRPESKAGTRRKSSTCRSTAASTTIPHRHAYHRSSDFLTTTRRVPPPISTTNPQRAIYSAYFNRRSRSLEPTPSPRLIADPMRSPTDSVSSGSTDVDPASDEESLFSPKDPEKYLEARQVWNGAAAEGKKGFYANVVDDYRLIGKDVSTANHLENKRKTMLVKPEVTWKKIGTVGGDERVKIAGVGPDAVGCGGQHMVPSSQELWG